MADVKLNSLATKTNANAAAILVKDSATQNQGAEGWITKAQLNQIIRDEVKAQLSAITSGTPDVPVFNGSTLTYMTLPNFASVVGEQISDSWLHITDYYNRTVDFNNLSTDKGIYIAHITGSGNTYENKPESLPSSLGNAWIIEIRYSSSYRLQIYRLAIGDVYTRHCYSTWGDVIKV